MSQKPRTQWTLCATPRQRRGNDALSSQVDFAKRAIVPVVRQWADRALSTRGKKKRLEEGIELLCRCGQWLWDVGNQNDAIEAFEEVVRICPSNVRAHNNLGVAYWNLGERASAVRHFRMARDLDPSNKDAVWNCGQIMAEVGEFVSARYLFESFLRDHGPDPEIATALVDLSLFASHRASTAWAAAH